MASPIVPATTHPDATKLESAPMEPAIKTANPVVKHFGTVESIISLGKPTNLPKTTEKAIPMGTAHPKLTASGAKFAESTLLCEYTLNAKPSTATGTNHRRKEPAPVMYSLNPSAHVPPLSTPATLANTDIATPPVSVGNNPTRCSLAGTRLARR